MDNDKNTLFNCIQRSSYLSVTFYKIHNDFLIIGPITYELLLVN